MMVAPLSPEREPRSGELILYQTEDGSMRIHLRAADGTVWLSQIEMAELFQTSKQNISLHVRNVFDQGELQPAATVKEYLTVRSEGGRQVERRVSLYRLEMVLAVGYRVRSPRGTQFRRWATDTLQQYLVKGFALDDQRLKDPAATDYFEELLERIRDIRASEKRFYQQVRDVFATTSVDYDARSSMAATFFKTIQNKLLFAVTGRTAAELIVERADPAQPHMALTTWPGNAVRKADASVSKNYLRAEEMSLLNRLTTMFLDFAELRASQRQQTTMADWMAQTDRFLRFNDQPLLAGAGRVSRAEMEAVIAQRFAEFDAQRRAAVRDVAEVEHRSELDALQSSSQLVQRARKKPSGRGKP